MISKTVRDFTKVAVMVAVLWLVAFGNVVNAAEITDSSQAVAPATPVAAPVAADATVGQVAPVTPVVEAPSVPNAGLITVDLVIFAGQSNMSGVGGDAKLAPAVPHGCGYEFRNGQDPKGMYEVVEPFGSRENGYISDPAGRNGTLVSAFMNSYYNATGVPVLGVSAARGGTDMTSFWMTPNVRAELMQKYQDAKDWCGANNVTIRHQYVVWLQGESDAFNGLAPELYNQDLKNLFAPLFVKGVEQVFVITPGNFAQFPGIFDSIINAQTTLCTSDMHFTLGSAALKSLPDTYLVDGIHYNQTALNLAGSQAAATAAAYSILHK